MPATPTGLDVRARRSAVPGGAGNVVTSMIRNRSCVTAAPVWLTKRRRMSSVPKVELFAGSDVKSRTRFGAADDDTLASSGNAAMLALRWIGDDRFSGAAE